MDHISDLFYLILNCKCDNKNINTLVLKILMNIGRQHYVRNKELFSVMSFKYFCIQPLLKIPTQISRGANRHFLYIDASPKMTYCFKIIISLVLSLWLTLCHLIIRKRVDIKCILFNQIIKSLSFFFRNTLLSIYTIGFLNTGQRSWTFLWLTRKFAFDRHF